jgi:ElaB/YqjD/DUF883 family membrane-anchored ribosome-binding protein
MMNAREMTGKFQDWQKRAGEAARNVGDVTGRYVEENTWTTIAIAAVVGCLIGYFVGREHD